MPDVAKIAEDVQAQGLDVVSTAGGIVVAKGESGKFLVYRNHSLEINGNADPGILTGFSVPQVFEIRLVPVEGRVPILVIKVSIDHEEDVRQLIPVLNHLFQAINDPASQF